MNKKDLTNFVAVEAGITKKDANLVIGTVLEGIKSGLLADGKVTLVGFGTFSVVQRAARQARNPKTGEAISVPAKMVPKFKPSKNLKDACLEIDEDESVEDENLEDENLEDENLEDE
jgi:DNA-binding protein HU-beta